jgi:hypothetical protein
MSDSTEETPTTYTSDECDFSFIVQWGELHPVGIICSVHGWTADVRNA